MKVTGESLSARCSWFSLLSFDKSFDSVDHILDKGFLGESESSLVGDVKDTVVGFGVLSMDASDLDVVLVGDLVEQVLVLHQLWKLDMNGGSQGGTEVGGAGGDVTEMVVVGEGGDLLNGSGGTGESLEGGADVSSGLHGDDPELVLLVDPDKESLVGVVENTSARGPVSVETAGLKESVSLPIKNCQLIWRRGKMFIYTYLKRKWSAMSWF